MKRRAGGAEGGLKFICAKGDFRVRTNAQKNWQCEQAATTRDRVHEARRQPGQEQQRDLPPFNHLESLATQMVHVSHGFVKEEYT